jgi:hypothetical protein
VEDEPPDRVRGQLAVAGELVVGDVPGNSLVLPVRLDQPLEGLARQVDPRDRVAQPAQQGVLWRPLLRVDAIEVLLDRVQKREPVAPGLVAGIVHESREAVDRRQVAACLAREDEERDREVLPPRLRHHVGGSRRGGVGLRPHSGGGHYSPMTWMKSLRARARSSSQKNTF